MPRLVINGQTIGSDARHVCLKSENQHVQHQADLLFAGKSGAELLERRFHFWSGGPRLHSLQTRFDLADAGEVFVHVIELVKLPPRYQRDFLNNLIDVFWP